MRVLTGRLERQDERLESLRDQEAQQLSELDLQRAALARQVRQAYVVGRQERLKLLLNQQRPETVARVLQTCFGRVADTRPAKTRWPEGQRPV